MTYVLSKPLTEPPNFLSTISMVVDDHQLIVQDLIQAERKSPSVYEPARALFRRVLQSDLSFDQALDQAQKLLDRVEKKCAIEILRASKEFLTKEAKGPVGDFPKMSTVITGDLTLNITQILIRHLKPDQLMVLHFWRDPLSPRQLSAAAAILKGTIKKTKPEFSSCELDFISVSAPNNKSSRLLKRYNWQTLKPLEEPELVKFWKPFYTAWQQYQRLPPRRVMKRKERSLFDL